MKRQNRINIDINNRIQGISIRRVQISPQKDLEYNHLILPEKTFWQLRHHFLDFPYIILHCSILYFWNKKQFFQQ